MTPSILPSDGPEREILLVSLQQFSDRCEAPDLIPECPFSVELSAGGRGCGEECEDLLKLHGRPSSSTRQPYLASELTIERLRRKKIDDTSSYEDARRPFDATETLWRNLGTPSLANWHSVALLMAVKDAVGSVPSSRFHRWDRTGQSWGSSRILEALEQLNRRGYRSENLIREGLASQIVTAIAGAVAVHLVLGQSESDVAGHVPEVSDPKIASWLELCRTVRAADDALPPEIQVDLRLKIGGSLSAEASEELLFVVWRFPAFLRYWVSTAELRDLIDWQPPENLTGEIPRHGLAGDAGHIQDRRVNEWIWDRFTSTYLADWSETSLQLEWRHFRGRIESPLRRREMSVRPVDPVELSALVADSRTTSTGRSAATRQMVTTAAGLIKDGHRKAAATLFGAVLATDLEDGEGYNNYGFCLLPDDVHGAYSALEQASVLGYNYTVNLVNRVLALHWMGRPAIALELALGSIADWEHLQTVPSFLWDFEAKTEAPVMLSSVPPRIYLVRLAVHIARSTDDELLLARWLRIASDLGAE